MNTSELTGDALNWAVAECNGDEPYLYRINAYEPPIYSIRCKNSIHMPAYHTDWSQGGWLIERERITLRVDTRGGTWVAFLDADKATARQKGTTPLIAAMRCYVASKLGDTVDIPEELQ